MRQRLALASIISAAVAMGAARDNAPVPSFRLDVMPVFFRAGCNSGGCHGAASGKDGFRLSLFGYDPAGDYFRLTQQIVGRRLDVAEPEQSLVLLKALGKVPHSGGRRFKQDTVYYDTLLRWIEAGAPDDAATTTATAIAIVPDKLVFTGKERTRKVKVMATYSDGTQRDVTQLALYLSNNPGNANIDDQGLIKAGTSGATYVFARFAKFTTGAEVIVLPQNVAYRWPNTKPNNYIDELVNAKLQKLRILPSALTTDEQFLRRVHIDLTGVLPSAAEYRAFVANKAADKRAKLIDELMERDEFADLWATKWAETLKVVGDPNSQFGSDRKAAQIYYDWIREQVKTNAPLDKFVRAQIAGNGSNLTDPAVNLYTMLPQGNYQPKAVAQEIAQVFTGVRIQCAECHNHPFDRWTQDDYYSFVSFFTGVKRKFGAEAREYFVFNDAYAAPAKHLLDNRPMPAKFLNGPLADPRQKDPRVALAEWLTAPDNELFRQNMANRIWGHFFGRGIVEPIDDVRISNPPANRELIEELGKRLVSYNFDAKRLMRDICNSRTYQLTPSTNATNKGDTIQFSHAPVRRLRADVLLDSISVATGVNTVFNNFPTGYRAAQIFEGGNRYNNYFLKTFCLSSRETVNASESRMEPTLSQALHLINGTTIEEKIQKSDVIKKMLDRNETPETIIDELYIRCLSRMPAAGEKKKMLALTAANPKDRRAYEDIFWGLLNSTEFAFNH